MYAIFPGSVDVAADTARQTITVSPAPLTIAADNKSRLYGQVNPTLTTNISGLLFSDTPADLGTISVTTTAQASSPVGTYPIMPSGEHKSELCC